VSRIGTALETGHHIIIFGKKINNLPFSFIAPLEAKYYINHDSVISYYFHCPFEIGGPPAVAFAKAGQKYGFTKKPPN
jgi:hypothetical protein